MIDDLINGLVSRIAYILMSAIDPEHQQEFYFPDCWIFRNQEEKRDSQVPENLLFKWRNFPERTERLKTADFQATKDDNETCITHRRNNAIHATQFRRETGT